MKKLLVLVLVLALSSLASAQTIMEEISLSYAGGAITITGLTTAIGDKITGGIYVSAGDNANATVGAPLHGYPAAGDLCNITQWEGWNGVDINVQKSSEGTISTGTWFDFGLTTSLDDVTFDIFDYDVSGTVPVGMMTVIIPEPATIALLCLGGLILRRRK